MHDYPLERLNTRSFEQLIQALGTEIIGPQLMIFGDGPDGGREAIFDGPIKYPVTKKPWNGYGIVQAKFRQQPDSSAKKNADWVIKQLKSEFAKLKPRTKRTTAPRTDRICPKYYIFATNLVLSPADQKGGKDRVRAVLDGFKKSHGLRDYAIWDGDQIRRFLDAKPGIRTTYSAWLLSGDVLAEMMKVLHLERTDFLSIIRRYLESELLDDQFARLGQGGYTDAKNIPLCSVFVDLPLDRPGTDHVAQQAVLLQPDLFGADIGKDNHEEDDKEKTGEKSPSTFLSFFFEEGRQVLKPSMMHRQTPRGSGKSKAGRLVLIGGPGQGKTTVGQYACQLLRAALLRTTGDSFSPEVSQALERIEQMSSELPSVCARRYPLRVDLKHLATSLAATDGESAKTLFDYLVKRITTRTNSTVKAADFRRWLGAYPWVLVLDGLDEVPASSNRQQVMQAVRDFVSVEAYDADADLLVLATTRPQGYSDEFDPLLYHHLSLAPLSASQALEYGLRLATSRHPGQRTRVEELTTALKRATTNPATVRLMQSPLQVTIMLALIEGGGEPPEQRWKLFHDYYDVIYRREKERGTPFSAILGSYEPDIHWIHHRTGWLLQQRNADTGRTDARLTHEEFEEIADSRLQRSGHDDVVKRRELVKAIQLAATDRLVLLVGNTEKEIGFEIRSLQEFMAAEHFFDGGESYVRNTLHSIAPYPYWRNVFLFAAGRIFFERQELIDCIIAVCGEMNDDPNDPAQRTILSGSRLALSLLKDGAARNQPASIRVIARCGARGLDVRDDEGVDAFTELFSGEAEEVWKEELSKRLAPSSSPFPYQNWLLCLRLVGIGKPWAQDLMLKRFPWKGEDALRFLMLYSVEERGLPEAFWTEFFTSHVFNHPPHLLLHLLGGSSFRGPLHIELLKQFTPLTEPDFLRNSIEWPLVIGGKASRLEFRIRGVENLALWKKFHYDDMSLDNAHPEWHVYKAITAFAQKPTKANLAAQLTGISHIDLDIVSNQEWSWIYPWQIGVCFSAKAAGYSWDKIVASVNNGNLGDEQDWERWEEQNRKGITISKFRSTDALTISEEFQGNIFSNAGLSIAGNEQTLRFANELSDALIRWPEIKRAGRLIDLCCFLISERLPDPSVRAQKTIERFLGTCAQQQAPVMPQVLLTITQYSWPVLYKLKLLEKAGLCTIDFSWMRKWNRRRFPEVNKLVGAIIDELLTSDQWWNVLRALSFLPPLNAMQRIPQQLIEQLKVKGDNFARAASILRLNSLRWEATEVVELVRDSIALEKHYPSHLSDLLDFIESGGESSPHLETFLIELIKENPPELEPGLLNHAASLLVKLVARRPAISRLPDPAIRNTSNVQ